MTPASDRNETCPTCRANDRDWRGVVPAPSDIPGVQLGTTRCFDPWHDAAPTPAPPSSPPTVAWQRDADAIFQRLADAVDDINAKVLRGDPITALDAGKAHVALRAYQNHRAALRGTTDDKKGG